MLEVLHLQTHSLEKSTISGYTTGARDYLHFCRIHDIPLNPTPETLSRYIAFTSLNIASGPKYLTGARHFLLSLYPDFNINRSNPLVQATIRGSKKVRTDPVHRKQPIRISHLSSFVNMAKSTRNFDDLLFATIMSCCFYGYIDWRKIIKRSSLHFSPGYADGVHGLRLPLFLREDGSHPTCAWFDTKLFTFIDRTYGGHSARAGGATFYASLGLSDSIIMALGRWSSEAWKIYIRDNPSVCAAIQLASIQRH
ncbi:hypothetical protein BYT27DRAFT_7221270 [Phlegmacium glaucopus]|nr:hypothetical protein BYT27DRAFT_7221270 [Phlegmacium glaucopus]